MIDQHYEIILTRIITIFDELEFIVSDIKSNYELEKLQDQRLTLEIVNDAYRIVHSTKQRFESYRKRANYNWSIKKYIDYVQQRLSSFYREFDNPFLGSERWYQRIVQLQNLLSQESRELGRLLEMKDNGDTS